MNTSYSSLLNDLQKSLDNCTSSNELYKIKSTFLGKKGILASQFNEMRNISHEEKTAFTTIHGSPPDYICTRKRFGSTD